MDIQYFKSRYGYEVGNRWYPKVTAICSTIAKPGLLRYYANQENFTAAQENLNQASDWGTLVHKTVENIFKGEKLKIAPVVLPSVLAFEDWRNQHKVSALDVEKTVVSKDYSYAGTLDVLAEIDGKTGILDLKTSTGIWDEYSLQLAAYFQAFNEMALPKVETRWILRVDQYQKCEICPKKKRTKENGMRKMNNTGNCNHKWGPVQGQFEFKELDNQERDIEAFLAARKIWEWQNQKFLSKIDNYLRSYKA